MQNKMHYVDCIIRLNYGIALFKLILYGLYHKIIFCCIQDCIIRLHCIIAL